MAVVFISPKQRQKTFFVVITGGFLLLLIIIFLGVFFSEPKEDPSALVFNKPKVAIDMGIFESDQFLNLQPFPEMQMQYSYRAATRENKVRTGFVFADSLESAKKIITNMGLSVIEVKEAEVGRENPFVPYYQTITQTKTTR